VTATEPVVTVRSLAAGGDGVATLTDGRTVFIPRAAPGDELRLRSVRLHARYARAEIDDVVLPGPNRVEPPCPHYLADRCGGCQLMHLDAAAQLGAKSRIAGDALRRIGHLDLGDPAVTAPAQAFGYRTKVTFTMQRGTLGYYPINDPTRVFEVRDCLIARDEIRELHAAVRAARSHLPRDRVRVTLRLDREHGRHIIVASSDEKVWGGAKALHAALAEAGIVACIWWVPEGGRARVLAGADTPWPATVFEQVNPVMAAAVRQAAIDALEPLASRVIWDLYAGIGETTADLARGGARVHSVERDRRAVDFANRLGPPGPDRRIGTVEGLIAELPRPDAIVTNPPRTGMAASVSEAISRSEAATIAYISCDPATLARDLAALAATYRVARVEAYDQFPQTAHMECLALLERR
jgi:23S rRNA (uracil1939-C5)-methyltransferase